MITLAPFIVSIMKISRLNDLIEGGHKIKGRWELSPNHEIQYKSAGKDEEFKFRGSLIAAEPRALVVAFTEKQADQKIVTRIVKLSGNWRLDSMNRIIFEMEREGGRRDVLVFKAGWKIGESNEIVYTYEVRDLRRKRGIIRQLVFEGFWDISEDHRLAYRLSGDSDSVFRFRGAFQTKSILAKKGEIRYQAGAEVRGGREPREIVLFGKWKFSRDLGLSFEIEYEHGRKKAIRFGGEYSVGKQSQIAVNLKTRSGDPLGVEVLFTRSFFGKDGQAFARLTRSVEESRVEAGLRFRI
jgi:hypothetical protein